MESLNSTNTHYILEASIEDLHKESKEWISKIEFWEFELQFFKKLILQAQEKSRDNEKGKLDKLLNLERFYVIDIQEVLEFILEHERYLNKLIQNKTFYNDRKYRENHKENMVQIRDFDKRFNEYKKELYLTLEKYL